MAGEYVRRIHKAVRETFVPQIEASKQYVASRLREAVVIAGTLTSLTLTLFVSDAPQIHWLGALGLLTFAGVFLLTAIIFFRAMKVYARYTLKLQRISNAFTEFSGECVKFSRSEITQEEFEAKEKALRAAYPHMRDNDEFAAVEVWDKQFLEKLANGRFSELNLIAALLVGGIVAVILSVVLPVFFASSAHDFHSEWHREQNTRWRGR